MIGWDDAKRHDARSNLLHKVFFENGFEQNIANFFRTHVEKQITENSVKYSSSKRRSIDIVRDVTNIVPILWLANRFAIPLKTNEHPHGLLTVPQAFMAYLVLFMYQSFNSIPGNEWTLRDAAASAAPALRTVFEAHLKTRQGIKERVVDWHAKDSAFQVGPDAERFQVAYRRPGW